MQQKRKVGKDFGAVLGKNKQEAMKEARNIFGTTADLRLELIGSRDHKHVYKVIIYQ